MPSVFICYRREDTAPYAGWLRQALVAEFGKDHVFMDIDTIAPGADFEEVIRNTLDRVDAVLVLIGPKWATLQHSTNDRRLDNPDDFVRLEVEAGLRRRIRVVPVLVGGGVVPRGDLLPEALRPLVRRQAVELSESRWEYDTSRLIESLKALDNTGRVDDPRAQTPGMPAATATPAVILEPQPVVADAPTNRQPHEVSRVTGAVDHDPARPSGAVGFTPDLSGRPVRFAMAIGAFGSEHVRLKALLFLLATTIGKVASTLAAGGSPSAQTWVAGVFEGSAGLGAFRWLPAPAAALAIGAAMGGFRIAAIQSTGDWIDLYNSSLGAFGPWTLVWYSALSSWLFYQSVSWSVARVRSAPLAAVGAGIIATVAADVVRATVIGVPFAPAARQVLPSLCLALALLVGSRWSGRLVERT